MGVTMWQLEILFQLFAPWPCVCHLHLLYYLQTYPKDQQCFIQEDKLCRWPVTNRTESCKILRITEQFSRLLDSFQDCWAVFKMAGQFSRWLNSFQNGWKVFKMAEQFSIWLNIFQGGLAVLKISDELLWLVWLGLLSWIGRISYVKLVKLDY